MKNLSIKFKVFILISYISSVAATANCQKDCIQAHPVAIKKQGALEGRECISNGKFDMSKECVPQVQCVQGCETNTPNEFWKKSEYEKTKAINNQLEANYKIALCDNTCKSQYDDFKTRATEQSGPKADLNKYKTAEDNYLKCCKSVKK